MLGRITLHVGFSLLGLLCQAVAAGDAPLHEQIDELIVANQFGPVAEPADDATFLRRVSLDLIGRIPTHVEVEAFLKDQAPDKRARCIDRLLASPDYPRHMAVVFDLMLMERRGGKHIKSDQFRDYLEEAFAQNRPYLKIVREILAADGSEEKNRAAAAFYLERDVEPHLLTRDVGRIFYGVDLQCAQCHNHPLIDDYYQPDYYGLQAFFLRSSLFRADKKKPALIAEQATGEASFASVFTGREGMIGPRVPGGEELVAVTLKPTEQYEVAPAKDVRAVPTRSRRDQLAAVVAESPSPAFKRNIVNRLWAHMHGRGLVHPVDLHHSANPPTHPAVLELLATRFAESGYDVKALLRELALTNVYQRSFTLPPLQPSIDDARRRISAAEVAQAKASEQVTTAESQLETLLEKLDAAVLEAKPLRDAEDAANKQVADALKAKEAAQVKVTPLQKTVDALKTQAELLKKSVETTTAAAESLKNDKEVAAALATLQERAAAHQANVEKQQTALTKEQATLTAATEKLVATSAAADHAIAARQPYEQTVVKLRDDFFAAREQLQVLRTEAAISRRNVTYLQTLVAYGEGQQRIAALTAAVAKHQQNIATNAQTIADLQAQVTTDQTEFDKAKTIAVTQQKQHASSVDALKSVQQTQTQLAESIASAESAAAKLADDAKLVDALALLQESLAGIASQVNDAQAVADKEAALLTKHQDALGVADKQLKTAKQALEANQKQAAELAVKLGETQQSLAATQAELENTWDTLVEQSSARGNAMEVSAMTPEQLGWSILTATGQYARQQAAEAAKLTKEKPLPEEAAKDPAALAQRQLEVESATRKALQGTISRFVSLYGAGPGQPQQEFFATADQSLFVANGNEMRAWLLPAGENLTQRLMGFEEVPALARELYVSVLSRPPTPDEVADVATYLAARPEQRKEAVLELAWALFTSVEFRFRH